MYYVPGNYLTILDHWGRGSLHSPQTYNWFVKEKIKAGDSNPYDYYFNLPAPWLKVRYRYVEGINKATYNCALDLFVEAIPIFNIPVYIKRKTVISSFKVSIVGPQPYPPHSNALPWGVLGGSKLKLDHNINYVVFPIPNMEQVKRTVMKVLSKEHSRPDFIVVEAKNIGNNRILTITGYKETGNKGEVCVIFSESIVQNEKIR